MQHHPSSRTGVRDSLTGSADASWRARLGEQTLDQLGWTRAIRRIDPVLLGDDDHPRIPARVVRVDRGRLLLVATGDDEPVHVHDRIDPPGSCAVGDWVLVDAPTLGAGGSGFARVVVPRDGTIARRDATDSTAPQVLAANVDLVLVAEALDPDRTPNAGRVARLVTLARAGGCDVLVVLTGIDRLAPTDARDVPTHVAGAPAIATSVVDGRGLDDLRAQLTPGTTAVVVGPSGAGKSSLANAVLGAPLLATGARRDSGTGRHVTSVARLVPLPGGAQLVDTPGIRQVGMHADVAPDALRHDRIDELAHSCRFGDCAHAGEPGCAVAAAIDVGDLDPTELDAWRRLQREARREQARSDARLRSELRAEHAARGREHVRARRRGEVVERRRE